MEVRPEDLTAQTDRKDDSRQLRRRLTGAGVALIVAFLAVVSATYAWYIYNTGRHTTKVRMAAGAGANLQISNSYDGTYGSAAILDSFEGLTATYTCQGDNTLRNSVWACEVQDGKVVATKKFEW